MQKMCNSPPPSKNPHLSKKNQEEEDINKRNAKQVNDHWRDLKLKIHWGKLKWVAPKK